MIRRALLFASLLVTLAAAAELRFPPPDFESGYKLPGTTTPAPRLLALQFLDVVVLVAALGVATWLVHRRRSRSGLVLLSLFSLVYFGFYREGCICAIGSLQNTALTIFDRSYAAPLSVLAFFLAPLVTALFFGRTFCAAVCPHGALQEFVLVKPLKVPMWLEHALGVVPFLFLGAGAILAATGCGFVICRYDPFVPLFRLSGSLSLLTLGAAFVAVGMFVGRPYCRFLCPYGALLRLASLAAKWPVRVSATRCIQCDFCEQTCPYGAVREPLPAGTPMESPAVERRRLWLLLAALPVLVAAGALVGSRLGPAAAQLHPTVALAELHLANLKQPANYPPMTPEALALERAAADPEAVLAAARLVRQRVALAAWLFGGWAGLVVGLKLIFLSVRAPDTDYEPDRGACVACARCYPVCPIERRTARPTAAAPVAKPTDAPA
jgi:ferredoxin